MKDDTVGIDSISFHIPRLYVDLLGEFSEVRSQQSGETLDKLRGKIQQGIGVEWMTIADFHEDAVTMAAMAAWKLIEEHKISLDDIGLIAVGTETTVDQSKSLAAYVLGMLERKRGTRASHIGCPQFQFACMGATYALESALACLLSGTLARKYAIVIATDIAKYPLMTPGEYTQGAGAVAMLLTKNPRLLVINLRVIGTATRDERDFFRPNFSKAAVVDGKYSIDVYLNTVEEALNDYLKKAELVPQDFYHNNNHFLFHVPFPRMGEYAAARFFGRLWSHDDILKGYLDPALWSGINSVLTGEKRRSIERDLAKSPFFRDQFALKVAPSLALGRKIGNIYSGSLFLALISLLYESELAGHDVAQESVVWTSYGSGASAKVFTGRFTDRWREGYSRQEVYQQITPQAAGGRRLKVNLATYENLHESSETSLVRADAGRVQTGPAFPSTILAAQSPLKDTDFLVSLDGPQRSVGEKFQEFSLERLGTENSKNVVDVGYRYYEWVE